MDTTKLHFKFSLSFQNGFKCWIWISKHISLVWYVLSTRVSWDKSNGLPWSSGWWRTTRLISDCFFFISFIHLIFILLRSYLVAFPYFLSLFRSTNFEGQLGLSQNGLFIHFFQSDFYLIVFILMLSHIFFFSFGLPMTSGRWRTTGFISDSLLLFVIFVILFVPW